MLRPLNLMSENRKSIIAPCWIVPAIVLWAVFGNLAAAQEAEGTKPSGARILTVKGKVEASASGTTEWKPAKAKQALNFGDRLRTHKNSRATVTLSDSSVLRVNQLTTVHILKPPTEDEKSYFDVRNGSAYFFSREKPLDVRFRTPVVSGAIRGTEFHIQVEQGQGTEVAVLDGEVLLSAEQGELALTSGERGIVRPGETPVKSPVINAVRLIQWCLYYPGVLDVAELNLPAEDGRALGESLETYARGDLLSALELIPWEDMSDSPETSVYLAAALLSAGRADDAEARLVNAPDSHPLGLAVRQVIAATRGEKWIHTKTPSTASEWLANSYYRQSRFELESALTSAKRSVELSPDFGFGWARVAELEFGFVRREQAENALARGLELSPDNAQALALKGFLLCARQAVEESLRWFDEAIEKDGGLGNAWLGRGLARIHLGRTAEGREDLQTAAALEPRRSLARSYLGKVWSVEGRKDLAEKELRLAKELDPADPTPWLYGALIDQQSNRINEAIRGLERSKELNDNRRLFRSRLLLDKDQAVRGANLAAIYRDAGMEETGFREAAEAVQYDYANSAAHLFLSQSYLELSDPRQFNLRYESARESERLIANLLAPSGAANLSRRLSQQEYSRMFDRDHIGFASVAEYLSRGGWLLSATQFGQSGNTGYAVDGFYYYDNGQQPNHDVERIEASVQARHALTPNDMIYLQAGYLEMETGDASQYYDPSSANPDFRARERTEEPQLIAGYQHAWSPESRTLALVGRFQDNLRYVDDSLTRLFFERPLGGGPAAAAGDYPFRRLELERDFELYSAEAQQIWSRGRHTLIAGARLQTGWIDASSELTPLIGAFPMQRTEGELDRYSVYAYHHWRPWEQLLITAGLSYERLNYPSNIDLPPIEDGQDSESLLSPRIGFRWNPWSRASFRGVYTRTLGGLFFDNGVRLEPAQIAGFNQVFRSLIPESSAGLVPGTEFETWGLGLDQSFNTGTYFGVTLEQLESDGERSVGVVTNSGFFPVPDAPSSTRQTLDFRERSIAFNAHQLLGDYFILNGRYRISQAELEGRFTELSAAAGQSSGLNQNEESLMQQASGELVFHHPSGFFGSVESVWTRQDNDGYAPDRPGEDFWQHHLYAGYRFPNRRAEIRLGLLNVTDQDYRLNPLNLHLDPPRDRTFTARLSLNF